jgi:ABC-type glycerol-3-phosphate transport system permease component
MMAVAAILPFTGIWNDFLFGVMFSAPGSAPVTVASTILPERASAPASTMSAWRPHC